MQTNERLENCLSAWVPRPPSGRVERRLFGGDRATVGAGPAPGMLRSLAPASFLVVLAVLGAWDGVGVFGQMSGGGLADWRSGGVSNQLLAAFAAGDSQSRHNGFTRERFEWTTGLGTHSSIASHIQLGTNSLKR